MKLVETVRSVSSYIDLENDSIDGGTAALSKYYGRMGKKNARAQACTKTSFPRSMRSMPMLKSSGQSAGQS